MRRTLILALIFSMIWLNLIPASAQQIPFLPELLKGTEEFNQRYMEKKRAGRDLSAIAPLRTRGEEAFRQGNIPAVLEMLGQGLALLQGKKWDDRQRFISSLTVDSDRLIIEGKAEIHVSLTRMFPANIEAAFIKPPTVTFEIRPIEHRTALNETSPKESPGTLLVSDQLVIAETNTSASPKVNLTDGAYWLVASIESEGKKVAEVKKLIFAIGDFTARLAQLSKRAEAIKHSSDASVRAVAQYVTTPEFQIERLRPLTSARGEIELYPTDEMDDIDDALSALAKGENPYKDETGEIERAYRGSDGKLVPYRAYIPENYDGQQARPLVVMLHGALGDERTYLGELYDPAVIKGEADRRGFILAAPNGRGRLSSYRGLAQEDVFEVIKSVSRDYRVDPNRIYLTGHSMGGGGVWTVAASSPQMFAAIAPVAGAVPAQGDATKAILANLKNTPVFVIHGARDLIVQPALSRNIADAAKKAGLKITYLEVADADHITIVGATFPAIMEFFENSNKQSANSK